jgi:uncharacterized membrane protein YqjE
VADDAEAARIADPQAGESFSERLNQFFVSLVRFGQDRFDLLRWEAAHEGSRFGAMLLRGFCAALLALFTLEVLLLLLVASFWDTPWRMRIVWLVAGASFVATALMFRAFLASRNEKSSLLHRPPPIIDDPTGTP